MLLYFVYYTSISIAFFSVVYYIIIYTILYIYYTTTVLCSNPTVSTYKSQLGYFQTWLLYHNALSSGVEIEDILKYARRSKEQHATDDATVVHELRAQVSEQQRLIRHLLERTGEIGEVECSGEDNEFTSLLQKPPQHTSGSGSGAVGVGAPAGSAAQVIPAYGSLNTASHTHKVRDALYIYMHIYIYISITHNCLLLQ